MSGYYRSQIFWLVLLWGGSILGWWLSGQNPITTGWFWLTVTVASVTSSLIRWSTRYVWYRPRLEAQFAFRTDLPLHAFWGAVAAGSAVAALAIL